jgi:hypothetical protein
MRVTSSECFLEHREQTAYTWQGWGHRTKLAQKTVPLGHGEAHATRVKPAEYLPETIKPVRKEVKRQESGVDVPAQDALVGHPTSVALEHLFYRRWILAMNGIGRLQGTKDVVNGV